jgi:hypothetical protein
MSTTTPTAEESIDAEPPVEPRTQRAVTGNMVVVPEGDCTGLFDVYSATDGHNEIYTGDLRESRCMCGDYEHRKPAGGCKHIRRVKLALGIMDVPAALRDEIDECLAHSMAKFGVTTDDDPVINTNTPDSPDQHAVATDGGHLLEAKPEAETNHEPTITGPHMEPPEISNATTYWRCEGCGHESIHKCDTERAGFRAVGCSQR